MNLHMKMKFAISVGILVFCWAAAAWSAEIFVRARVLEPQGEKFILLTGGHLHKGDPIWYLPQEKREVSGNQWSEWLDLRKWDLHARMNRVGGLAEWPSMKLTVRRADKPEPIRGCLLEVQLADRPDPQAVVIRFQERSGSDTIGFLLPHPLRQHKEEFETGSQMAARHLRWAQEAVAARQAKAGLPPLQLPVGQHRLQRFQMITSLWGPYDPLLARQWVEALRLLGFNVIGGVPEEIAQQYKIQSYTATWHLLADPEQSAYQWTQGEGARIAQQLRSPEGRQRYENLAHYVICDEIQPLDFRRTDREKLNGWFRQYLRQKGLSDESLGMPIDRVQYPAEAMYEKHLPREANLTTRKIMYYAGKFGQWWTVQRLRQTSQLIRQSFACLPGGMKTETLPSDHCFFNAWGPPHTAMGYRGLDFFEIGQQEAVDIISAEDWLGLNHMYGPAFTWTGQHALGYLCAIYRSGIGSRNVQLRALITPSDDGYLRLKAYAALAQGCKSFFFWTFGPTYIGTENYWSDLQSQYHGLAKLCHALQQAEHILSQAQPVRDPVALVYSVSHDMWHTDRPAHFVENRLTWAALRHLGVQPDLLREEDLEAGQLRHYQVAYLTGQCLTRKAAQQLDQWVRQGGILYLCAGAATRDEFYEPYLPPFAAAVWPENAAQLLVLQTGYAFNERVDLPTIKPITHAEAVFPAPAGPSGEASAARSAPAPAHTTAPGAASAKPEEAAAVKVRLKVIGCRLNLRPDLKPEQVWARFDDGAPAAATVPHGRGKVIAVGLMPGLAYSPYKPGQTTLDEVWPEGPRMIFAQPLRLGLRNPRTVQLSHPVVEGSLLSGPAGSAIVLINHTYQPIPTLRIELASAPPFQKATSTEGVPVRVDRPDNTKAILELPLEWTDIVLLQP